MDLTNAQITERRDADLPKASVVKELRLYAAGKQPDLLAANQKKLLGQRAVHAMNDNLLKIVLKTTASRLRFTGWTVEDEARDIITDEVIAKNVVDEMRRWLKSLFLFNKVGRLQYETHYAQLRDGNAAVGLRFQNPRVRLSRELWWDGDSGLYIAYDGEEPEFAVREWNVRLPNGDIIKRRNVYYPGEITRWVQREENEWKAWPDLATHRIDYMRDENTPLPIPFVHFPNGTEVSDVMYGESDIFGLLALQDDVNSVQRDISAAALLSAFQRIAMFGVSMPDGITMTPGAVFGDENDNAKVHVLEAGDMSQLINVHAQKRSSISIDSSTPMHVITGEWPSGAALLQADIAQTEKVEGLEDINGPAWIEVAHRSTEIANVFGKQSLNENIPLASLFAPAERIDELTKLEVKSAEARLWEILARLPLPALQQLEFVDPDTAKKLVEEREKREEAEAARFI